MGVPPNHLFLMGFSIINHWFWYPHLWKPPNHPRLSPKTKPPFFVKSPGFSPDGWNPVRCPSQLHVQNPQGNIHQGHEDQNPGRTDSEETPRMVPSRMKHSSLCFFKHAIYRYIYIYRYMYMYIYIYIYVYYIIFY